MSSSNIEIKKKQHQMVIKQTQLILKSYNLSEEELARASKDIADVILTSWDLTESNLDFGDTWFRQPIDDETQLS